MPAQTHQTPVAAASRPRDPWFDNAKMALVVLVVVGHSWTLLPKTATQDVLYDFLYVWHVPAFVLVTGYLSRSFAWERARMSQLVRTVAVPYVVFEALLALFRIQVGGEDLDDLFLDPHWPMWYLSALFFWRLMTPLFKPLWGWVAVALAVATSLLAGLYAGNTFDVARVLGLLPFFVIGLKATPERLDLLRSGRVKLGAVGVLVTIFVLSFWTDTWATTEYLYYRALYDELPGSDLRSGVTRGVLLLAGTLGALAFLALVPRVTGWFSRMGTWTLVVYLFHGFVIKTLEYAGYTGWASDHVGLALVLTTLGAAVLALFLAWRPVASKLNRVVDPVGFAKGEVNAAHELRVAAERTDEIAQAVQEAVDRAPAGSR